MFSLSKREALYHTCFTLHESSLLAFCCDVVFLGVFAPQPQAYSQNVLFSGKACWRLCAVQEGGLS